MTRSLDHAARSLGIDRRVWLRRLERYRLNQPALQPSERVVTLLRDLRARLDQPMSSRERIDAEAALRRAPGERQRVLPLKGRDHA